MKILAGLLILVFLSGCESYRAVTKAIALHGAMVADEALKTAHWETCTAATAGSLRRSYWLTQEGVNTWVSFCNLNVLTPEITLPPPQ